MPRVAIIISAVLFLLGTTELHQLCRLPLLVTHYRHHRSADNHLSFFHFLQLHYTLTHPDDKDESEDLQLPFKTGDIQHTDAPLCLGTPPLLPPPFFISSLPAVKHSEGVPGNRSFDIFHPPNEKA